MLEDAAVPIRANAQPSLAVGLGLGSLAALVLAVVATLQIDETSVSPLEPDSTVWRIALIVGALAAFALYLLGLAALRRQAGALTAVVTIAVAIQLAPLASPLLLSRDAYLYWDYGRAATVHGGNPYADFPNRWPDDPAYKRMSSGWARLRSPYGPGWTLVGEADAKLAGSSAQAATRAFRVLACLAMLAIVSIVAWSTGSRFATALVGWNPLFALHFAGGGHSDALMMAFVAGGLALASRRPFAAGTSWVGAVSVKVAALAFLGIELVARLRERNRRWFGGLLAGGAVAIVIATATFGVDWVRSAGPISNQLREANSVGIPTQLTHLGLSIHQAQVLVVGLFAALYLWILREAWHGRRRDSLAAGGLCLTVSWLMPWYGLWPLALAAFDRDRAGTLLGLALSGYLLVDALPI
jgi:hypothetical protein